MSPRAKVASAAERSRASFVEDFCTWQDNPHYRRFIFDSPLAETAGRLMRSTTARLYHDHMLTKEPATRQPTPWHQDQPYYNVDGTQNVSFWIPGRPREPRIDPGVRRGLAPRALAHAALVHGLPRRNGFPRALSPICRTSKSGAEDFPILGWELEPGDAVCFHMLTLHASRGVEANRRRRVFSVRFLGDDIVHAPRRWKTSPEFPGLADELPAGAPMHHPLFPELWRAP